MKHLFIAMILFVGTYAQAYPQRPLEFSRMTPTRLMATKLSLKVHDLKFTDIAWVSSLDMNRDCDQILQGVHELRLHMEYDRFTFILNGKPMHHLTEIPMVRTPRGFRTLDLPNTVWLKVADWVTIQVRITQEDGVKKLKLSVFRPHHHEKLTPILEGLLD